MPQTEMEIPIEEFIAEAEEILARMFSNLGTFEKRTSTQDTLDELYRDMHTLKGSAQLFGFAEIGSLSHAMETSLDPIRKNKVQPDPRLLDVLFKSLSLLETLVVRAKNHADTGDLKEAIREMSTALTAPPETSAPTAAVNATPAPWAAATPEAETLSNDTTIRVQVALLDKLMNLIGEMVLVRNQVLQYSNRSENLEFLNLSQRLDVVTSDLQDQVMKTRMQPLGNVIGKFQRLIRDLARDLGKEINLTIQGKDTELDKTLLEAIRDPITHIVRNACDHGLESAADRRKAGKPDSGHILIRAFHEGGQVIIEISDDGRGINRKGILKKAIERGMVPADRADSLTDRDILSVLFLPGFSTVEQVSAVSGRGVGMDVVRTNVEKIGGSVDLESVETRGTTVRLRIPLTLAIVPAMLVKAKGAVYAIPQVKLVELVRIEGGGSATSPKIQYLQGKPVYELRGKILPLVDLETILHESATSAENYESRDRDINLVVLKAEDGLFGLIVEEVLDTADIVVKPLSKFLKSLEVYSAATILGTGDVALIVDPLGVAKVAHLTETREKREGVFAERQGEPAQDSSDAQEYLLFKLGMKGRCAIPLCLVSRLEELSPRQVEYSGEQALVRYRDTLLPLIHLNESLGFKSLPRSPDEPIPTIVVSQGSRSVGVVVDSILDVMTVETPVDDSVRDRPGILGNLISGQEIITVVDVLSVIRNEISRFGGNDAEYSSALGAIPAGGRKKILYAEDVAFFRRQVAQLFTARGFEIVTANDGRAASELLLKAAPGEYSLIISDIEMPKMNGLELARFARSNESLRTIPLIALTTRVSDQDRREGREAGFDAYLEKLNPELLLNKAHELIFKPLETAPNAERKNVA